MIKIEHMPVELLMGVERNIRDTRKKKPVINIVNIPTEPDEDMSTSDRHGLFHFSSPPDPGKRPPFPPYPDGINPSIAGFIITDMSGDIIYCTSNWQPNPQEVKNVVNSWRGGNSVSVMLQGVKFSVLQCTSERFISTNINKQGHLVGSTTPGGQCILGFILPDYPVDDAYMDLARVAGQIRPGGSTAGLDLTAATVDLDDMSSDLSNEHRESSGMLQGGQTSQGGAPGGVNPDAQDVQSLLHWVQDTSNGFSNFLQYCIQNRDMTRLGAIARFYRSLRQILG